MKKLASLVLVLVLVFSFNVAVLAEDTDGETVTVSSVEELQQAVEDESVSTILIKGSSSLSRSSSGTVMVLAETMMVTHDLTIKAADDNPIIIKVAGNFQHMYIAGNNEEGTTVDFGNIILDGCGVGGGVQTYGHGVTINSVVIQNCAGEGINVEANSSLTINNSTISNNTSVSYGGGISVKMSSKLTVNNSIISDNTASRGGGIGLYITNNVLEINDSIISGNTADYGGGIYAYSPMDWVSISNSSIKDNTACEKGGGIYGYTEPVPLTVDETSTFSGNKASTSCYLTDLDIIAIHDDQILTKSFTEPFTYGYNNYDIWVPEIDQLLQ